MKGRRGVLIAVAIVLFGYVGWSWQNGRLAGGPRGLLHPVGDYWVKKNLQPKCFTDGESTRAIGLRVSVTSSERNLSLTVSSANSVEIRLRGSIERNLARGSQSTDRFETTHQVVIPVDHKNQRILVNDIQLPECK